MKRAERHHLKQDELVHGIERASDWFQRNQKTIVNAALVVVGAALLLGGLYLYRVRQSETARALLAEALDHYHGVVGSEQADSPDVPTFATLEEKYRASLDLFEGVAEEYSSYREGRQARYYVGLCQAALKDFEAADDALQKARSGDRDLLYYLSSRALASVREERGDHTGAAEIYRGLVEDGENPLPKDHLLFALAKVEERAGNLEQARQYYQRVISEHPDSQLRGDAMTRSETIELSTRAGG